MVPLILHQSVNLINSDPPKNTAGPSSNHPTPPDSTNLTQLVVRMSIQQLITNFIAGLQQKGAAAALAPTPSKISIKTPEVFEGDCKKSKEFLQACKLYFQARTYNDDQKVAFAFLYIDHVWKTNILTPKLAIQTHNVILANVTNQLPLPAACQDWNHFETEFNTQFKDEISKPDAQNQIMHK